jgi:hypothetical protein
MLYTKDGRFDLNNPQYKLFKGLLDGIAEYDNAIRTERSRLGEIAQRSKTGVQDKLRAFLRLDLHNLATAFAGASSVRGSSTINF